MMKTRAKRETTLRTETLSVRLDPKLRYLAKIAAQKQRRPISSFVEWAIEKSLALVEVGPGGKTLADHANFLWDVDEPDRFIKLALNFEELLNHEEQIVWKIISQNSYFWTPNSTHPYALDFYALHLDPVEGLRRSPDLDRIAAFWHQILDVANGRASADVLPKPEEQPERPESSTQGSIADAKEN